MDVLFKRGNLTDEDIRNIIDDVSSDPEDKKTLLEILALDDEGTDSVDGASISNASRISIKKDFTYVGLLAATENRPFTQRDVLFRHCLKNPGKRCLIEDQFVSFCLCCDCIEWIRRK